MSAFTKDQLTDAPASPEGSAAPPVQEELIRDLTKTFKLLSDETRLRILLYLTQDKELHVRALCERLGQSQPAVSHHLAMMRTAGVVEARRDGKHNYYHILPGSFQRLLELAFDALPHDDEHSIRFKDFELSYKAPIRPR
ncbi:MAG: metalloregulator ArsR/SmtB family transcription factor [Planctomycetia bacterium]|nr:metalloregulator ArsR/SmtB family transcription factor [Planctomycetia bacterium]